MNFIIEEMERIGADGVDFCSIAWRYFLSINKPFPIYKSFTKEELLKQNGYPKSGRAYWKMINGKKNYYIGKNNSEYAIWKEVEGE
mgnify:FL=1